ncbi:MAG: 16S rRNA (uracil(1498)-N(3))-methyltransferase [Mycobacteriaceae bacterium]
MAPPVFHLDLLPSGGGAVLLDGPEGRHAATVRRLRVGERLLLSDGRGGVADATVRACGKDRLELDVDPPRFVPAPAQPVTVVQALVKSERSDLAVELATEAGVDELVPWGAARCVARWSGPKVDKGLARWSSVAREAAKQARRARVPVVHPLADTTAVVALVLRCTQSGGTALVLHESATTALAAVALNGPLVLVVGPEGGISDVELELLAAAGAQAVHLGPTVLRTSTAAAVALGAIGVLTARWSLPPFV